MSASIKHIVLAAALACPAWATAEDQSWVEIAGSYYNPDWEARESESGVRVSGQYQRGSWYVGATYNTIDTKPVDVVDQVVRLRGLPFGDWREVTVGYSQGLAQDTSWRLEAAYLGVTVFDSTESGYSIATALTHRFGPRVSGSLRLTHLYLEEQDWRLTGEILVSTGGRAALVARIDDFAEFDFTWYELGMRFFF